MARSKYIFLISAAIILLILVLHISLYTFLTDDAFISYRYAVNLADGHGLVFNLGEKVEGYTNFLWVLILALIKFLGPAPENAANVLSLVATLILIGMVYSFNRVFLDIRRFTLMGLIAPLLLALSRSFAVWASGGLETRLFTLLIFLAVTTHFRGAFKGDRSYYFSALFFAIASLTRPEGILLFGSFWAYRLFLNIRCHQKVQPLIKSLMIFIPIVGAHFIFRMLYYGYPFPNTFYAKVTGAWFNTGLLYLLTFIHEYGLYLAIPLAVLLLTRRYDPDRRHIIMNILIPFAPYAIYIAYIGGDHFEYRQLDVFLPFLAIILQEGIRTLIIPVLKTESSLNRIMATAGLIIGIILYTVPSIETHLNFPTTYNSAVGVNSACPNGTIINRLPGLKQYLLILDRLHFGLATDFVCIRQEEHRMAMEQVFLPQARLLTRAVEQGYIDRDEVICLWCVGAIPYYSGLTTIDYLGLTDAHVAHRQLPQSEGKLMAHEKRADYRYLQYRRAAYISTRPAIFIFPIEDFLADGRVIEGKLINRAYLVPIGEYAFVFRSVFLPQYFINKYAPRGISFYQKDKRGQLTYYPTPKP
nr:hypothetical protein [candidate division Zixibacteria bacterium]